MPEFMLDDGYVGLIRAMDLHDASIEMARKLGIRGEVRTMVGKWEEGGQITGWTKQSKAGRADVLLEVFASKLDEERREFDSYVRIYERLRDAAILAHNVLTGLAAGTVAWETVRAPVEQIRAALGSASVGRNPEGEDRADGLRAEHEHAVGSEASETPVTSPSPAAGR